MAQQINLLTPILLKPRRHFTAVAMVQALGLIFIGCLALAAWMNSRSEQNRIEFVNRSAALKSQHEALTRTLATMPGASDVKAIEAQIVLLKQQQRSQTELLQALASGQHAAGDRHSDLLSLLARSVPSSVWLQGLRWQSGQLELSGGTLDPSALRGWVSQLQTQAQLHRIALADVRLELVSANRTPGESGLAGRLALPPGAAAGQAVWAFQVKGVSPTPVPAPGTTPGAAPGTGPAPSPVAAASAGMTAQVAQLKSGGQP